MEGNHGSKARVKFPVVAPPVQNKHNDNDDRAGLLTDAV
jgi:hypothetical protein